VTQATKRIPQETEELYRPPAPVRGPERAREGGAARPPADWARRSQTALFVLVCLLIANVLAADVLVARSLLGWHG